MKNNGIPIPLRSPLPNRKTVAGGGGGDGERERERQTDRQKEREGGKLMIPTAL